MKTTLLLVSLAAAASASAQSALTLNAPDQPTLVSRFGDLNAFAHAYAPADGAKNAQVWLGVGEIAYEHFSGESAGDEFGFTPTGYLGYQRNYYPGGRTTNNFGYSLGVGFAALGAAFFYHQGAVTAKGVDFKAGVAADFVYFDHFTYFGDNSHFNLVPFIAWGIKL